MGAPLVLRLGLALLLLVPLSAQSKPATYRVVGVARGDSLNIRELPDAESDLIGQVPRNGRVRGFGCTDETRNRVSWCRVKYGNVVGWVREKFVEEE
jgi:uncharacterized protein YraI